MHSDLPDTEALEAHLTGLLDKLEPVGDALRGLISLGYYCDFFCSHFTKREATRIGLTVPTISRLAALGIGLTIDSYCEDRADGDDDMTLLN